MTWMMNFGGWLGNHHLNGEILITHEPSKIIQSIDFMVKIPNLNIAQASSSWTLAPATPWLGPWDIVRGKASRFPKCPMISSVGKLIWILYIYGFLWTYLDFTWIYLDFTWIYLDSTWILYGFYMDSLWIYMNLQMVFQKYLQLLLVDPGSPRRSEQFSASVVKNIHWTQTQPVSGVDCVHIYICVCSYINNWL